MDNSKERLLRKFGKLTCKYNRTINFHRALKQKDLEKIRLYLKYCNIVIIILTLNLVSISNKVLDDKTVPMEYTNFGNNNIFRLY